MRRCVLCRCESEAGSAVQYLLRAELLSVLPVVQLLRRGVLLQRVAEDCSSCWPADQTSGVRAAGAVAEGFLATVQSDRNVTFAVKRGYSTRCLFRHEEGNSK